MNKFKEREQVYREVLPKNQFVGLRLDGKAFHSFTKQFSQPYDLVFMDTMDKVAEFILTDILTQALFAYVQSDEISVIMSLSHENSQLPFNGKAEKILSVSASAATGAFLKNLPTVSGVPMFDARLFLLESLEEVFEYVEWRRADARKNSVSMSAESVFSHHELKGRSTFERAQMLQGTAFEQLPEGFYHGRLIHPVTVEEEVVFFDKRDKQSKSVLASRRKWVSSPATFSTTQEVVGV